jgi:hypothetical protein
VALLVAAGCCATLCVAGEEKLLLGFEKKEMPADGLLWKGLSKGLTDKHASQGKTSFRAAHNDRWGFLAAGRGCTFYGKWRYGRVFRTLGWFQKVLPADWSGYDLLRVDYRTDGPAVKVRLEAEDMFLPFPAAQEFDVPGDKWVTLEFDLAAAAKQKRLDLKRMTHLLLMVVEHPKGKRTFASYLDNIRLARRGAPAKLDVIKGGAFLAVEPGGGACAKRRELAPLEVGKTARAEGRVYCPVSLKKPGGYPLLYVNERCIGGFGEGGIILAPGARPMLSLDAGKTWQGLGGKGKGKSSRLTGDHRGQHRSQTMIVGTDVFMAYCTSHCGGGGARVTAKFTRAVRGKDRWVTGPESLVDVTARYCHDRFALCRGKSGRLWCAWSHLNRLHKKDIRAKWSQDSGTSWLQAGENARVGMRGVFHYPGTPGNYEGPYLTRFDAEVACFWRRIPEGDVVWTRALPLKVKAGEVRDGKVKLPVGLDRGVKVDCDVLLEKDGNVAAVLTVAEVEADSCLAIPKPGSPGSVRPGDELTVMTWAPVEVISKGGKRKRTRNPRPQSAATDAGGVAYLGLTGGNGAKPRVLRWGPTEKKWGDDAPPGLAGNPMLSAWGKKMACLWFAAGAVHLSVKPADGKWGPARKIAEEQEGVNTLAVPQDAPEKFLPVAWGTRTRRAIKVVAVPAGE